MVSYVSGKRYHDEHVPGSVFYMDKRTAPSLGGCAHEMGIWGWIYLDTSVLSPTSSPPTVVHIYPLAG